MPHLISDLTKPNKQTLFSPPPPPLLPSPPIPPPPLASLNDLSRHAYEYASKQSPRRTVTSVKGEQDEQRWRITKAMTTTMTKTKATTITKQANKKKPFIVESFLSACSTSESGLLTESKACTRNPFRNSMVWLRLSRGHHVSMFCILWHILGSKISVMPR